MDRDKKIDIAIRITQAFQEEDARLNELLLKASQEGNESGINKILFALCELSAMENKIIDSMLIV